VNSVWTTTGAVVNVLRQAAWKYMGEQNTVTRQGKC